MFSEKVSLLLVKRGMKKKDLAEKLGCSRTTLHKKMKNDIFDEDEMKTIAEILNCTYEINLIMNDTHDKF